jgi:hypothetical protein
MTQKYLPIAGLGPKDPPIIDFEQRSESTDKAGRLSTICHWSFVIGHLSLVICHLQLARGHRATATLHMQMTLPMTND